MARQIEALRSEADYEAALDEIEAFFDAEPAPGSVEARRFEDLLAAVNSYEQEHWPLEPADSSGTEEARKRSDARRAQPLNRAV